MPTMPTHSSVVLETPARKEYIHVAAGARCFMLLCPDGRPRIQYCLEPWDCIEHLGTVLSACVE